MQKQKKLLQRCRECKGYKELVVRAGGCSQPNQRDDQVRPWAKDYLPAQDYEDKDESTAEKDPGEAIPAVADPVAPNQRKRAR